MKSWLLALTAVVLLACKREPSADERPTAISNALPTASAPPKPAKPWYEGTWSGTYEAALNRIEAQPGGVRAWKEDDGGTASGAGTLSLSVDAAGVAHGKADGPLGALSVNGHVDEQTLRLMLAPRDDDANAFRGVLVAERADDKLSGTLSASSGDSLTVRAAKVELQRAAQEP